MKLTVVLFVCILMSLASANFLSNNVFPDDACHGVFRRASKCTVTKDPTSKEYRVLCALDKFSGKDDPFISCMVEVVERDAHAFAICPFGNPLKANDNSGPSRTWLCSISSLEDTMASPDLGFMTRGQLQVEVNTYIDGFMFNLNSKPKDFFGWLVHKDPKELKECQVAIASSNVWYNTVKDWVMSSWPTLSSTIDMHNKIQGLRRKFFDDVGKCYHKEGLYAGKVGKTVDTVRFGTDVALDLAVSGVKIAEKVLLRKEIGLGRALEAHIEGVRAVVDYNHPDCSTKTCNAVIYLTTTSVTFLFNTLADNFADARKSFFGKAGVQGTRCIVKKILDRYFTTRKGAPLNVKKEEFVLGIFSCVGDGLIKGAADSNQMTGMEEFVTGVIQQLFAEIDAIIKAAK